MRIWKEIRFLYFDWLVLTWSQCLLLMPGFLRPWMRGM